MTGTGDDDAEYGVCNNTDVSPECMFKQVITDPGYRGESALKYDAAHQKVRQSDLRCEAPVFVPTTTSGVGDIASDASPNDETAGHDCASKEIQRRVHKDFQVLNPEAAYGGTNYSDVFFERVRTICALPPGIGPRGPDAYDLAAHRSGYWPSSDMIPEDMRYIYKSVRDSGLPNYIGRRMQLPSSLNLDAWEKVFGIYPECKEMLDFVKYGFPMGYMGPTSDLNDNYNHSSAEAHAGHIDSFIEKEIELGGVIGPFTEPPFSPWIHCAPLMSRPKNESDKRRVISDLTFPYEKSLNAYIMKNGVAGETRDHSLPTVEEFVGRLSEIGPGAYMSTIDISRAYKNFKSDPMDWPLLCMSWRDRYYCDVSMPFGSRASSYHMQTVANAIVCVLAGRGVVARMYLDDIIVISDSWEKAKRDHQAVKDLLLELGLPEAKEKAQPPAQVVRWLGINIDAKNMRLSIPAQKVSETLEVIKKLRNRRSMSRRELQSVIGRLIHIAKCVSPARLFVSRLLDGLREMNGNFVNINAEMKKDFEWFRAFCVQWNGVSLIPQKEPTKVIAVDACLSGIGGTDGSYAYALQVRDVGDGDTNISEIEAINVVIALQSFVSGKDIGGHIHVLCDNLASVQVFKSGKGKNKVLLEAARMVWMLQATFNFDISFDHIKGSNNVFADSLSRAHLSSTARNIVNSYAVHYKIKMIYPCLYALATLDVSMSSRSHCSDALGQGIRTSTTGMGTGDDC